MTSNECTFSTEEILQIVANNIVGNVVLNKQLEKCVASKDRELLKKYEVLETKSQNLEAENAQLKAKLSQYESTSLTSLHTDSQQLLIKLNQEVISTINAVVVKMNENRSAWDAELTKLSREYKKCKENLEKINLKVSNETFEKKLREYRKNCDKNDDNRKNTFKELYEIDSMSREKLEQNKIISSNYAKEIEIFIKEQKDRLDKIRELIFMYELNREKKSFEEALRIGKEETTLYQALLSSSNKAGVDQKVSSAFTVVQTNSEIQCDFNKKSFIAFDLPDSANLQDILDFLNDLENTLNLTERDIEVTKTFDGRTYRNLTKITLPSAGAVNKIIKGEKTRKVTLKGTSISLLPYKAGN